MFGRFAQLIRGMWWEGLKFNLPGSMAAQNALSHGMRNANLESTTKTGPRGIYRQRTNDVPSIQLGIRPVAGGLTKVPGSFVGNVGS